MKRLYVGGLSHSVTDKDLKDRFGKFGKVEDVELKTRTDTHGVPYKTFGYININISDSDLKKCLSVLNKTQWKGGTLRIEAAKESFLQRLSQEREDLAQLSLTPPGPSSQQKVLDSLKEAGVSNFTMKSAVPGTEIPGHKNWVVGKFGRVLPVLQLKCRRGDRVRTVKYDPSKYGQNLRVLALPSGPEDTPTPVSHLTWTVEGGDDDISRKRRGEFLPYTPKRRKMKENGPSSDLIGSCNGSSRPIGMFRAPLNSESEEELLQIKNSSHNVLRPEDNTLEVVSSEYTHRKKDEDDCDSADTDELFSRKPQMNQNKIAPEKKHKKQNGRRSEYDSIDNGNKEDSGKKVQKVKKSVKMTEVKNVQLQERKMEDKESLKGHGQDTKVGSKDRREEMKQGGKEVDSEDDSDYDYNSLFSNVVRLEMSLSDLEMLAEKYAPEGSTPTPRILSVDDISGSCTSKKGTTPEEILASILEGGSTDEEERMGRKSKQKKRSVAVMSFPAFRGTEELEKKYGGKMEEEDEANASSEGERDEVSSAQSEPSSDNEEDEKDEEDNKDGSEKETSSSERDEDSSELSSEDEEEEAASQPIRAIVDPLKTNLKRSAPEEEAELQRRANERRLAAVQQRQKEAEQNRKLIQGALSKLDSALGGSGGKHIVFGSEEEEEEEETHKPEETQELPSTNQNRASSAPRLFDSDDDEEDEEEGEQEQFEIRPEFEGAAGHKLMALQSRFGTDERFKMDSRFLDDVAESEEGEGSDHADAMSEQQEALEQEKHKNLSILQSILGPSTAPAQPGGGSRAKAQTFRDVSALHYDPSKEEHAAFEKKLEETKESKASRRKKREEAQKLPEVSKEIYFEVNTDLKSVFGKETEKRENQEKDKEEERNWDQKEEGDEERGDKELGNKEGGEKTEKEESGEFKFSFFGDEPEPQTQQIEYKVQNILAPKLSWQHDPRLNDSSEEEEDEERGEEEDKEENEESAAPEKSTEATSSLFFFFTNDPRLTDGPRWFCRTSLEEQRETWDETRTQLRQDCKKKHKDARRKLRVQR